MGLIGTFIIGAIVLVCCAYAFRQALRFKASVNALRNTLKGELRFLAIGIENVRTQLATASDEQKVGVGDHFLAAEAIHNRILALDLETLRTLEELTVVGVQIDEAVVHLKQARRALGQFNEDSEDEHE